MIHYCFSPLSTTNQKKALTFERRRTFLWPVYRTKSDIVTAWKKFYKGLLSMTVITSLLFFHSWAFWSIPWCFSIGFLLHSRLIFMKSLTANKNERQKKWFLNLNCTKCLLLNFAQKWFFKTFPFISDKNIRDHSYIREINSLNSQNSCTSLSPPNMPLHFLLSDSIGILKSPSLNVLYGDFFKRSWLKEFPVLPITPHKVLISKRLEV